MVLNTDDSDLFGEVASAQYRVEDELNAFLGTLSIADRLLDRLDAVKRLIGLYRVTRWLILVFLTVLDSVLVATKAVPEPSVMTLNLAILALLVVAWTAIYQALERPAKAMARRDERALADASSSLRETTPGLAKDLRWGPAYRRLVKLQIVRMPIGRRP